VGGKPAPGVLLLALAHAGLQGPWHYATPGSETPPLGEEDVRTGTWGLGWLSAVCAVRVPQEPQWRTTRYLILLASPTGLEPGPKRRKPPKSEESES
jgi:hypothetical protein